MFSKRDLYAYSRMLHAYISAFAFLALMFFSLTGLFLNNPQWFQTVKSPTQEQSLTLPAQDISSALKAKVPMNELAKAVGRHTVVRGIYKSGEIIEDEALLHFEGVKGKSNIVINLKSGLTEVTLEHASPLSVIQELHRGKNSGHIWKIVIDITAYLILALSLIGYILFFSLRFRLATSLTLTGISLLVLGAIFWWFVP